MPTHRFPDAPPHAIAHHGVAQRLLDTYSEARVGQIVRTKKNREVGTRTAFSGAINNVKVAAAQQPRRARKL